MTSGPRLLREVRWFGLGPHETYGDRVASARVGLFGPLPALNLTFPFVRPQETGHREGVRRGGSAGRAVDGGA